MKVVLTEEAFRSILLSTVNMYPLEWFGLLVGHTDLCDALVEEVVPILSARSAYQYVRPYGEKLDRVVKLVPRMMAGRELLGDVHSHTGTERHRAGPAPSRIDLGKSDEGRTYVIAAINPQHRKQRWRRNSDGSLSGTLGGYHVRLGAYQLTGRPGNRWVCVELICPFALGFEP